jgi:hypothetical protein
MERREPKSPEGKVMNGRLCKITMTSKTSIKQRKQQQRRDRLKKISKQRYTNASKELLDLYETTFGVPGKFKSPARLGVNNTIIERSRPLISPTRADENMNSLKDNNTHNYSTL